MRKFLLKSILKWLLTISLIFLIFLMASASGAFLYREKYKNKIYPGVKIGSLDLSGKDIRKAERDVQKMVDEIIKNEIHFFYESSDVSISPLLTSASDPDLVKEILTFEISEMTQSAYAVGRGGKNIGGNFLSQINLLFNEKQLLPIYTLDENEFLDILKANLSSKEKLAKDAKLIIDNNFNIRIEKEETGYKFNYEEAILNLIKELDKFNNSIIKIPLSKNVDAPRVKGGNLSPAIEEAKELLALNSLNLTYQDQEWVINKNIIKDWITPNIFSSASQNNTANEKFKYIKLDKEKVIDYLDENIALAINITPQNAKFEIKDGKVIEFQTSRDGRELDLEKNYEYINTRVIENKEMELNLIVTEKKAEMTTGNINNLGIKEIIGIGKSNFKGSPKNRRHNIKIGADTLNGLLIEPEENFSLVNALGEVNAEKGYLPELVIKGNRTIPEYGGGLCQIGTTLFRVALDSGLPITERRNHSYRVSYYEPAGTDATIYNPKPDMRFINDTGNHILIQTKIEGDDLIFEFWGTKDGRIIDMTEPKIYNIVKPGPTKLVETEDLEPGEKKCTESSHNGADAIFHYKVSYPDDKVVEIDFESHYKPWQAVCLVGKEKATSTDESLISN